MRAKAGNHRDEPTQSISRVMERAMRPGGQEAKRPGLRLF